MLVSKQGDLRAPLLTCEEISQEKQEAARIAAPVEDPFDWGTARVFLIEDGRTMHGLLKELFSDNSSFQHNTGSLLNAFAKGKMYGLHMTETLEMFKYTGPKRQIFVRELFFVLPALCVCDDSNVGMVEILWVHSRARGNGFGSAFLQQLNITSVRTILHEAQGFWAKHPKIAIGFVSKPDHAAADRCHHEGTTGVALQTRCPYCHPSRKRRPSTAPAIADGNHAACAITSRPIHK
jgi:GNAT superfamily N-acetyltransferase